MASTIRLVAESEYGYSGQYIARITGRAARVKFAREFCGTKSGKRGDCTTYETDECGLYEVCDVGKHGKDKSFYLVLPWRDEIRKLTSDHEDTLAIAKRLDGGETLEQIIALELEPMTETKYVPQCTECKRSENLDPGPHCPDHPNATVTSVAVEVPKLKDDGTRAHRLVYAIRTKGEAKKAEAAGNVDAAVDAIVAALQALPAPLAKQALATAKAKLFPKPASEKTPDSSYGPSASQESVQARLAELESESKA